MAASRLHPAWSGVPNLGAKQSTSARLNPARQSTGKAVGETFDSAPPIFAFQLSLFIASTSESTPCPEKILDTRFVFV